MLQIRSATREDVPVLISLIRRLAAYENKAHQAVVTREDLLRDGFGPQPKFRALVALWDEAPAGYASFFYFYSSFRGRAALFLEDLFVLESFRDWQAPAIGGGKACFRGRVLWLALGGSGLEPPGNRVLRETGGKLSRRAQASGI